MPFGTAAVDGVLGPEWANALAFPMSTGTGLARLMVMNDAANPYIALFVPEAPGEDRLDVRFDNDADGILEEAEDELIVLGPAIPLDSRLLDARSMLGPFCCWGYVDPQQDGAAAVGVAAAGVSYELSHPLNSGDAHDMALGASSEFGLCALYYDAPSFELRHFPPICGYAGPNLSGFLRLAVSGPPHLDVRIDIKPGSDVNPVNLASRGKIPVAILSTAIFDAQTGVDISSLTFGALGDEPSLSHCDALGVDVNTDALADLICHFNVAAAELTASATEGFLRGMTVDGIEMTGKDTVRPIE